MADEAHETNGSPDEPSGVFGNLPATRPGTRSPRRAGGDETDPAARATAAKPAPPKPGPPEPPPAPPDPAATPGPPPGAEREPAATASGAGPRITNVEDLAWAGIAVAAEAATVGVRFASRALEAARKSIDRP